jgi:hypothetical protein
MHPVSLATDAVDRPSQGPAQTVAAAAPPPAAAAPLCASVDGSFHSTLLHVNALTGSALASSSASGVSTAKPISSATGYSYWRPANVRYSSDCSDCCWLVIVSSQEANALGLFTIHQVALLQTHTEPTNGHQGKHSPALHWQAAQPLVPALMMRSAAQQQAPASAQPTHSARQYTHMRAGSTRKLVAAAGCLHLPQHLLPVPVFARRHLQGRSSTG